MKENGDHGKTISTMQIKFIKLNKSRTQIDCETNVLDSIRSRFTSIDPNARYQPHGTGLICPVSAFGSFETPLMLEIIAGAKALFPEAEIKVDQELFEIFRPNLSDCPLVEPLNSEIKLYDYQKEAALTLLKYGRGVLEVPTRGGKSFILSAVLRSVFVQRKNIKTALLMVPNTQLVSQMFDDFIKCGIPDGIEYVKFSSTNKELPKECGKQRLIISNAQWIRKHLDELPKKIDILFIDEVQGCTVNSWLSKFVKMFETKYKFGCTGTLPDDVKDQWNIKKLFGPVIYSVPATELINSGYIAHPEIIPIQIKYRRKPDLVTLFGKPMEFDEVGNPIFVEENMYDLECQFLNLSEPFNSLVAKMIEKINTGNRLILFDRIAHGRNLFDRINAQGCQKFYVDGEVKQKDRKEIVNAMNKNNHAILVANTACMGVGITIGSLSDIFLISIRSASTSVLQNIGRGLKIEDGKISLRVFDIYSNLKYSTKHFNQRCSLYSERYGIKIKSYDIKTFEVNN